LIFTATFFLLGSAWGASVGLSAYTSGDFRWLDINDQAYASSYISSYDYDQASVTVDYSVAGNSLTGTVTAENLKPFFAYQLKLVGLPDDASDLVRSANERIGMVGRYWEEEWTGSPASWGSGANLNSKGDGSRPSPNDETYLARRTVPDGSSPTGLYYRYTGYKVFYYFVTDADGDASFGFSVDSSYHVLWKWSQRSAGAGDGPVVSTTFDPDTSSPAYDTDYGESTVDVYGEWERLPVGGVGLLPGEYECKVVLTEESFHYSGDDDLDGNWAAAMEGTISFRMGGVAWQTEEGYLAPDTVEPGQCLYFEGDGGGTSSFAVGVYDPSSSEAGMYTRAGAVDHFDSLDADPDGIYTAFSTDCYAFSPGDALGTWTVRSGTDPATSTDLYGTVQLVPFSPLAGLAAFCFPLVIQASRLRNRGADDR